MGKYAALVGRLEQLGWSIERADRATQEDLQRVHTNEYIQTWFNLALTPQEERKLGLPQSAELLERSLCSVGGTLSAMMQAFETGYGVNLAGGTHHAFADRGEGFCVFNDLAVASRKAVIEGLAKKILVPQKSLKMKQMFLPSAFTVNAIIRFRKRKVIWILACLMARRTRRISRPFLNIYPIFLKLFHPTSYFCKQV
jgi:hypothetical protein